MKHEVKMIAAVAACLYATGCTQSMTSTAMRSDTMSVSVQFVIPSEEQQLAYMNKQSGAQLAADSADSGFTQQQGTDMPQDWSPHVQHVALWGGPHQGTDVTMNPTALQPGSYTFAFFDQPNEAVMQGWMDVQNTGSDLVGILSQWKDTLSQQKQRLAYDFEIDGRTQISDPDVFKSFKKQIDAYDQLERQVQKALNAELRAQAAQKNHVTDMLTHSDVVIMPGEDTFFRPTTNPTFTESELETVRNGDSMTKLVLAADYEDAQWKLQRVQQLYGDLARFKQVLKQEADRLERQKGMFLLTDHLYHHDKRFVENEMRLQNTLGMIDRCEQRSMELRDRRLGLAFVTSLFTPDRSLEPFYAEENALRSERTVLDTELNRLDAMAGATDQNSVKRVAIERNRQRVMTMIDSLNNQMEQVDEARMTMMAMAATTDVIHRHNDMRLLTTTLVSDEIPYNLLQNIKQQAMMSVRLEMTDKVYVPRFNPPTSASAQSFPTSNNQYDVTSNSDFDQSSFDQSNMNDDNSSIQTQTADATPVYQKMDPAPQMQKQQQTRQQQQMQQQPVAQPVKRVTQNTKPQPVQPMQPMQVQQPSQPVQKTAPKQQLTAKPYKHEAPKQQPQPVMQKKQSQPKQKVARKQNFKPATRKVAQKPQPQSMKKYSQKQTSQPVRKVTQKPQPTKRYVHKQQPKQKVAKSVQKPRHYQTSKTQVTQAPKKTSLAAQRNQSKVQNNNDQDCPWFVKLLVPPCWITSMEKQGQVAKTEPKPRKAKLTGQKPKSSAANQSDDCHWLVKLFAPPCWTSQSDDKQTMTSKPSKKNTKLTGHSHKTKKSEVKECSCWLAKVFVPSCWFFNSHKQGQVAKKTSPKKSAPKQKSTQLVSQNDDDESCSAAEECSCWLAKVFVPSCWCHDAIKRYQASLDTNGNSQARLTSQKARNSNQNNDDCGWLARLLVPPCWFNNGDSN